MRNSCEKVLVKSDKVFSFFFFCGGETHTHTEREREGKGKRERERERERGLVFGEEFHGLGLESRVWNGTW